MLDDFSTEYSKRSDDELLHLATQRHSLTPEARNSLDEELRRRGLTESDRLEHQKFVKRQERRESKSRRRRTIGPFQKQASWLDILCAFATIGLISFSYLALPKRYHMSPDWAEAVLYVMIASVIIIAFSRGIFLRRLAFWISIGISSTIHLFVVHPWTKRTPNLGRGASKGATFLGFFIFLGVYWLVRFLQRKFDTEENPYQFEETK
jgi:hypothetical protein